MEYKESPTMPHRASIYPDPYHDGTTRLLVTRKAFRRAYRPILKRNPTPKLESTPDMQIKPNEEQIIIDARISGDAAPVHAILSRYAIDKKFNSTAMRILGDACEAEDAVQDALLLALRKWHQFKGASKFRTWFTRIVITSALMRRRKNKRNLQMEWINITYDDLDDAYAALERKERLWEVVNSLDPDARDTAARKLTGEQTYRDMKKATGRPISALKTDMAEFYAAIRNQLADKV